MKNKHISVQMGLVVVEKRIEKVLLKVVELDLVSNLFVLYTLEAESKRSILTVLKVFVVMVDFEFAVA
jgi:hypothetical protein